MNLNRTYVVASGSSARKELDPIQEELEEYDSVASSEEGQEKEEFYSFASNNSKDVLISNRHPFHSVNRKDTSDHRPKAGLRSGLCNYESQCAASLRMYGTPNSSFEFSPSKAHLQNKWGTSAKNWSLWNAWDSSFLTFPLFINADATPNLPCDPKTFVNFAFQKKCLEDKGWKPLNGQFLVLRVILEEKYYPFTQQMTMDAHQLIFIDKGDGQSTIRTKAHHVKILACAGLAEIFQAVVNKSDILIISGGYDLIQVKEENEVPLFALNFNKEQHTQIIRVPATLHGRLTLYEKIEPLEAEKRFKFTYVVRRGTYQRTVEQHRNFDQNEFCRKVTDTLAYSRVRWDFPVPIVTSEQAVSLYELLCCRGSNMPALLPRRSTKKNDETFDRSPVKHSSTKRDKPESIRTSEVFQSFLSKKGGVKLGSKSLEKNKSDKASGVCWVILLTMLILALTVVGIILAVIWLANVCPLVLNQKQPHEKIYNVQEGSSLTDQNLLLTYDNKNDNIPSGVTEDITLYYEPGNKFYSWVVNKTSVVVDWIDIAVRWARENCNLQCLLAKLGFPINEVVFEMMM